MFILKIGGGTDLNIELIAEDLLRLQKKGEKFIIVHGANEARDNLCEKLGVKARTLVSPSGFESRYTDKAMMEVILMSYAGLANKNIVAKLQSVGINAVGLSGVDGKLLVAEKKKVVLIKEGDKVKSLRDNLTGKVKSINTALLNILLDNGYTPVITIPVITEEGEMLNTENDRVVALLVKEMKVHRVVSLFSAPGLLKEFGNDESLINSIALDEVKDYTEFAKGRMRQKLLGVMEAVEYGACEFYLGDGRAPNPITRLFAGEGTAIK